MKITDINWWHSIDLGDGVTTPGRCFPIGEVGKLCLPDLTGKSVLDIGTWDGFYAFEAEKRGAARVVATDHWVWHQSTGRAGFDYARTALQSNVIGLDLDVMDHSPAALETNGVDETYDVVLFLGVLYHLRHPLLALERVASVVGDLLILETYTASARQVGREHFTETRPALVYMESDHENSFHHKFFGPNVPLVLHWLKMVGFKGEVVHEDHRVVVHARRT